MRWGMPIEPFGDELLSSFLTRAAHCHGLSPYRFGVFHFPEIPVWNRDIDRSAPRKLIEQVSAQTGLSVNRVLGMTLQPIEWVVSRRNSPGTAQWINSVGVFHRIRRRHGLQFCPECLALQPVYLRAWRLSFVTHCPVHGRRLLDACPHCDAPVVPHRQFPGRALCHVCHRPLLLPDHASRSASRPSFLETLCLSTLASGRATVGDVAVTSRDFFFGLRTLASIYGRVAWRKDDALPSDFEPMERARISMRSRMFDLLTPALRDWPDRFLAGAEDLRMTRQSFARTYPPVWLQDAVRRLPPGHPRQKRGAHAHGVRQQLAALQRRKPVDWRSLRAELLCRELARFR